MLNAVQFSSVRVIERYVSLSTWICLKLMDAQIVGRMNSGCGGLLHLSLECLVLVWLGEWSLEPVTTKTGSSPQAAGRRRPDNIELVAG